MTNDEALAWIARLFDERVENIRATTARDAIAGWDSLGMLTLMADLDEKFDIQVGEKETSEMVAVQDILDLLARHGKLISA
jgi:acyl carrier protein